jgi:uncharacterized membrane-anchored protein
MKLRSLVIGLLFGFMTAAFAADEDGGMTAEQFEAQLNYQSGKITLPGKKAVLNVPTTFRYLDPVESKLILENAWGNPPGKETLGMLFPADVSPLTEEGWGVVITYVEDGHISDEDADAINYDEMLTEIQKGTEGANAARRDAGYPELHILGWAERPFYDKSARKLYWAKEIQFGGGAQNTLNYDIRVLGREGVLVMNAVAGMNQLALIKTRMQDVLAFTEFTPGNTYADFNESTDKVATYGIAALVGGALAAKTGLLAKLMALLVAGKKFLILAVVAVGAAVKRLFARKREPAAPATE